MAVEVATKLHENTINFSNGHSVLTKDAGHLYVLDSTKHAVAIFAPGVWHSTRVVDEAK